MFNPIRNLKNIIFAVLPFSFVLGSLPVIAQQIVPNKDGTMTVITKDGNSFNIDGGKLSQDGKNLFHSFQEFGLDAGQIANFLSNPDVQNILGRINGGNPSVINGLLQVTGGNSNLYLMNPAGIVFGNNATLNVPGDFAATTATSIGIGDSLFKAVGSNDYLNLVGNPNSFNFSETDAGTIINAGNLEIAEGHNISLTAGTVVNTGTIEAPGGNITVAAVPGTNRIRISQAGQILNLEVEIPTDESGEQLPVKVTDLPNLLRGLPVDVETGVEVAANDTVTLTDSDTNIDSGDITVKKVAGENITLAADNNISLIESEITATGNLNIQANNTVAIADKENNPFIAASVGDLIIQGEEKIKIFALNHPESGLISGGDLKLRSQDTVDGDARYFAGGDFRIEQLDGTPGNLFSPFDPVIRANGDVFLADYTGASLHILAGGEVNTEDITINSPDTIDSITETVTLSDGTTQVNIDGSSQPTLDIRAGIDWSQAGGLPGNTIDSVDTSLNPSLLNDATSADITTGNISFQAADGVLLLTNQYFPNTSLSGGNITTANIRTSDVNDPPTFTGNSGSIFIDSRNNISVGDSFLTDIFTIANNGNSGSVLMRADNSINVLGDIATSNSNGFDAGSVDLAAGGDINIVNNNGDGQDISALSSGTGSNGGNIDLTAGGNIVANGILGLDSGGETAGNITLNAGGDTNLSTLDAGGIANSGNITVTSGENLTITGSVVTQNISGLEGQINLEANNISLQGTQVFGGDITLTGDEIDLPPTIDAVSGLDNSLTIQKRSSGQNVTLNATEDNADSLDLTATDLDALNNGFSSIIIGQTIEDDTSTLTVNSGDAIFSDPVTFQAGNIVVNGNIQGIDDASINLNSISINSTTLNGSITTQGQPIDINDNVIVAGNTSLDTTNGGFDGANISIQGGIDAGDSSTGDLSLTSGLGDIEVTGAIGNNTPSSGEVVGNLTANSNGNIAFAGNIDVGSLTTNGTGTTFLNGTISTVADQTYNTSLSLNQNGGTTLQGNDLNFNAPINLGTGGNIVNIIAQNRVDPIESTLDDGDITFAPEADINFNGVGNSVLSIEADNNINLGDPTGEFDELTDRLEIIDSDPSTPDSLNLTLTGDRDNNNAGGVYSDIPISVVTGGGEIDISGKSDATGNGVDSNDGIRIVEDISIDSGGGNITLTGNSILAEGIQLENAEVNSGGGDITIQGTTANNDGDVSDDDEGVKILESRINSGGGNITILGESNGYQGLLIGFPRSNDAVLDSEGGNISLTGKNTGINDFNDLVIQGGDVGDEFLTTTINSQGGNLTITADEIDLQADANIDGGNVFLNGTGNLLIQPDTLELNIAIASIEDTNRLDISNEELTTIGDSFNSIIFGRENSRGTITVADNINFNNSNLILQSPATGGAVAIDGNLNSNGLRLNAGNNINVNTDINSSGDVNINSANGTITTRNITATANSVEETANINISTDNNISTGYLSSSNNITVDANGSEDLGIGLFTASGTIPETNTSIQGESVTIEHGGGNQDPRVDFTVGDAATNGTLGDIVTSENITTVNSFPNSEVTPNETIQILTTDEGVVPPVFPPVEEEVLPIVAEIGENSSNSVVTLDEDGVTFNLTGGLTSNDSENPNLFHSYSRFDLPQADQTANFVVDNSAIRNILARVSSGDASEIAGTIAVTGGTPNLFFINPAGIIFGENASLNVPADFTVTTANGVGFGEGWFSASGNFGNPIDDNPQTVTLNGDPNRIAFSNDSTGKIINLENNTLSNVEGTIDLPNDFDVPLEENNSIEGGAIAFQGSVNTNGNNLTIAGSNDVNLTAIDSASETAGINAGDITIFSTDGGINVSSPLGIYSYATSGDGGDITLYAESDINLIGLGSGASEGNGGDITITSNEGGIDLTQEITVNTIGDDGQVIENNLDLGVIISGAARRGGNVTLNAAEDIATGYIYSGSFGDPESDPEAPESFQGGTISLESIRGEIDTSKGADESYIRETLNFVNSSANIDQSISEIELTPSNIAERLLFDLPPEVRNNEDVNFIDAVLPGISSFSFNNSGTVTLTTLTDERDITVTAINAESLQGDPGDVEISTRRFFRATGSFASVASNPEINLTEEEASISTFAPPLDGGDVTIRHGGDGKTPFAIGDPEINGTEGNIYSSSFPFEDGNSFLFTEIQDRISIISINPIDPEEDDPGNVITKAPTKPLETNSNPTSTPTLNIASIPKAKATLMEIGEQANRNPALVYVNFAPEQLNPNAQDSFLNSESCRTAEYQASLGIKQANPAPTLCIAPQPSDRLEILVITSEGEPIYLPVDVTREEVEEEAKKLYRQVSRPGGRYYKAPAKKLYQWLIGTIEADLKEREIDNILFIMPPKLRSLPIAALYDGEADLFLAQKDFNVGFAPSLNLMNTKYRNIQESPVLAFGASDFEADEEQEALPAVEIELPTITQLRGGKSIANENFTFDNLKENLDNNRPAIVHLSTHADFNPQNIDDIYIQLYDRKLSLNELKELKLNDPVVDLLVISACRSAFGDNEAELGFGGLAVKAGVKTAIGSLWYVGDTSTSALMSEFYHQLKTTPTKAEALRKAQQGLIEGQVKNSEEAITTTWGTIPLPENLRSEDNEKIDWSHPYFWAPFTVIGSPW